MSFWSTCGRQFDWLHCLKKRRLIVMKMEGRLKAEQKLKEKEEKEKQNPEKQAEAAKKPSTKDAVKEEEITPNEYFKLRSSTIMKMKEAGQAPYPHKYHVDTSLQDFIDKYNSLSASEALESVTLSVAGN